MYCNSSVTPIFYPRFCLHVFQVLPAHTKELVVRVIGKIDEYANGPDLAPVVKQGWGLGTPQSLPVVVDWHYSECSRQSGGTQ
jgi:hypothetical protein